MKMGKYLKFHFECLKNGGMPKDGLCNNNLDDIQIFKPTNSDLEELMNEGLPVIYWGAGENPYSLFKYTPLRQNIVLLMAAMNGEL